MQSLSVIHCFASVVIMSVKRFDAYNNRSVVFVLISMFISMFVFKHEVLENHFSYQPFVQDSEVVVFISYRISCYEIY